MNNEPTGVATTLRHTTGDPGKEARPCGQDRTFEAVKARKMGILWAWFIMLYTAWLPDAPAIMRFRGWLMGLFMKRRGKDFQVASNVRLLGIENISVGDHVYLAPGVVLSADREITLGDEVMIAYNTVIVTSNHTLSKNSYRFGPSCGGAVHVGRGTWVCANCTVVAGVRIGERVVVAANAAVVKDVGDRLLVGGVPAVVIRSLESDAQVTPRPPRNRLPSQWPPL